MYTCKMTVDMMDLEADDQIEGVENIVIAGDFLDMIEGAQIVFI